jgi:hypothetical protein
MLSKIFSPKNNGFLLSNAFGMAAIGISKLLMKDFNGTLIFSEFIIVLF